MNEASDIDPPAALVTGASRGIGRGIALSLAEAGFEVVIHCGRNEEAARAVAEECAAAAPAAGLRFPVLRADLAGAERAGVIDRSVQLLGRLDALVNNAGIGTLSRGDPLDASEESFETVVATNLAAPHFLARDAARHWLRDGRSGEARLPGGFKIAFISSVSAAMVSPNRADYCISKAGLAMASQVWAARLAEEGIQALEFRPGVIETDMTAGVRDVYDERIRDGLVPQRRWGTAQDVGRSVRAFLRGDLPFTTGSCIWIDGGLGMRRL